LYMRAIFFSPLFLVISSPWAAPGQGETADDHYCIEAQQIVAGTELLARVELHGDYDSFVQSKPTANPLAVQMYRSDPVSNEESGELWRVLSCKMKPAERLNAAYPAIEAGALVARGEADCDAVNRYWLQELSAQIPESNRVISSAAIQVDHEQSAYMGPTWLSPWPFTSLSVDEQGQWHIHSKSLYVPFNWWIPMPDRFKGQYYCHLIYPPYLEAVLRGEVDPPG
jgi:hypothetical protein